MLCVMHEVTVAKMMGKSVLSNSSSKSSQSHEIIDLLVLRKKKWLGKRQFHWGLTIVLKNGTPIISKEPKTVKCYQLKLLNGNN